MNRQKACALREKYHEKQTYEPEDMTDKKRAFYEIKKAAEAGESRINLYRVDFLDFDEVVRMLNKTDFIVEEYGNRCLVIWWEYSAHEEY